MNRDATITQAARAAAAPRRAWPLAVLLISLAGVAAAAAPPPAKIDLDAFDAMKKSIALPDGEALAYVSMGNPAGRPVVLIHGYTDSASDWAPVIPYLSPGLHLIVVDVRGHGLSGRPECCYTRFDFAYDIKLLLDALGIGRADVVGHSMGSAIAQTFAELWPDRTERVVLISSAGGLAPGEKPAAELLGVVAAIRQLRDPIDPDSQFMKTWWATQSPVDEAFVRHKRVQSAAIPARVWQAVLEQQIVPDFLGSDLRRTLPSLTAPTLLIWGSEDPLISESMRAGLREALPQAEVRVFQGLGHNPFWEQPAQCAAVINEFLEKAPAPEAAAGTS